MIELKEVTKFYGPHAAVRGLNLKVETGEILGFLGPNGAGKSTTMRIITGYMPPTTGEVRVEGIDVMEDPLAVKRRIGYLPENPPLYNELTVREYLGYVAELKGIRGANRKKAMDRVIEETGLTSVDSRLLGNLSKGFRQRAGLAQALLGNPPVLILDEPTVGLDPRQISEIRDLIKELAGHRTVILSTHILPEVSMLCQRVAIINRGELVAQDTPDNLALTLSGRRRITARIRGAREEVRPLLERVEGVNGVRIASVGQSNVENYELEVEPQDKVREDIFFALAGAGCPLLEFSSPDVSLEEIFLQLITDEKSVESKARRGKRGGMDSTKKGV